MKRTQNNKRPTHTVFTVEGEGDNAFWHRIGVAWQHEDGLGLNIVLSAYPVNGRLVVRVAKANEGAGQ